MSQIDCKKIIILFDMRYWKLFSSPQNVKQELNSNTNLAHANPGGIFGQAMFLTNKLISVSNDCQRQFDSIYC